MEKLKIDNLKDYNFLSNLKFSPAGDKLCFIKKKADKENDGYISKLWIYSLENDELWQLTSGKKDSNFIWLDNENILFTSSRKDKEEEKLKPDYREEELKVAAVDFGGEFNSSIKEIIKRAVVAAEKEEVIADTHTELGAVAGASREALNQVHKKATGFNVGGKVGIARRGDHISVAVFFAIGLLHLNEMAIGLGHRAVT